MIEEFTIVTAPRRWAGALLAFVFTICGVLAVVTPAGNAATTSPFDPALNGATEGTLAFYDASGTVITSGTLTTAPAYAVAATNEGRPGDTKASLYAATPVKGSNAFTWPNQPLSSSTAYPLTAGAPANLLNQPQAIVSSIFTWFDPDTTSATPGYQQSFPNTNSDAAWQNLYQLRILTSGVGQAADPQKYSSATISIDEVAGTWTQVFPDPAGTKPVVSTGTTITGTAKVGNTLTCVPATFTGADSTAITWERSGTAITGATATTYKLASTDAKKPITCTTTGTNANGNTPSTSAAKTVALGDALKATTKPTMSGKPRVGKTLTCKPGAWSPKATSYGYQWLRNGKAIKGQTKAKHKIVRGDKGKKISCKVTAKRTGYKSGTATSAAKRIR